MISSGATFAALGGNAARSSTTLRHQFMVWLHGLTDMIPDCRSGDGSSILPGAAKVSPHRLRVRISDFRSDGRSSNLLGGTNLGWAHE